MAAIFQPRSTSDCLISLAQVWAIYVHCHRVRRAWPHGAGCLSCRCGKASITDGLSRVSRSLVVLIGAQGLLHRSWQTFISYLHKCLLEGSMGWHGLLAAGLSQPAKRASRGLVALRFCDARSKKVCSTACLCSRLFVDPPSRSVTFRRT